MKDCSNIPLNPEIPEVLNNLGIALGLICKDGETLKLHSAWFSNPETYLGQILTNSEQREAAIDLAEQLLGTAREALDGLQPADGESWIRLAGGETAAAGNAGGDLYLVLDVEGEANRVSLGGRAFWKNTGSVELSLTLKVPLLRISADLVEAEMLLGGDQGKIDFACSALLENGIGDDSVLSLDGISIVVGLPTNALPPSVSVMLKNLQLPGDATPADVSLADFVDELDETALKVMLALLRSQADLPDELLALLSLLGLDATDNIPSLPVGDLATRGAAAFVDWFRGVLAEQSAFLIWRNKFVEFLQLGTPNWTGEGSLIDPYAHNFAGTGWSLDLIIAVENDAAAGATILYPGLRVKLNPPLGAPVNGACIAELHFAALTLSLTPKVKALPYFNLRLDLQGAGSGYLVDVAGTASVKAVQIKQFRLGLALDQEQRPVPLLELHEVTIAGEAYPVLDLSSVDAIQQAGETVLGDVVGNLLNTLLSIDDNEVARSLAAMVGLVRPAGVGDADAWPALINLPQLFSHPLAAIGCYHIAVLSNADWGELAKEFAVLLRPTGLASPSVSGAGSEADPWLVSLFDNTTSSDDVRGQVRLQVYKNSVTDRDETDLFVALRTQPFIPAISAKTVEVAHLAELLRMRLPAVDSCSSAPLMFWAERQLLDIKLSADLQLDIENISLRADTIQGALVWHRVNGVSGDVNISHPKISIDGRLIDLPTPLNLSWQSAFPNLPDFPWPAFEALFGNWLSASEFSGLPKLGAIFGWGASSTDLNLRLPQFPDLNLNLPTADWPKLQMGDLFAAPWPAIRDWFVAWFSGGNSDFPDFSLPAMGWLSGLFSGDSFEGVAPELQLKGNGTYADPWAIRIGSDSAMPELLFWIDPDGPSLAGLTDLVAQLLPAELTAPLEGAGAIPATSRLAELLSRASSLIPELRSRLGDTQTLDNALGNALDELVNRISSSDGLVELGSQQVSGWESAEISPTTHLLAPAQFDPAQHLPDGAPSAAFHIYVSADLPGLSDWPGQIAAKLIDLRSVDLAAAAFDLSHVQGAGPWFILLPNISDVTALDISSAEKFTMVLSRLRRAVQVSVGAVGGDVALIAHSTAGLVARQLASETGSGIRAITTLATPHGGADLSFFNDPAFADGLRAIQNLHDMLDSAIGNAADLKPLADALKTVTQAVDEYLPDESGIVEYVPFPVADFSAITLADVASGVAAMSVGCRIAPDFDRLFATLIRRVLEKALTLLPGMSALTDSDSAQPMTHLGFGVRSTLTAGSSDSGDIRVASQLRLDLHSVKLDAAAPDYARPIPQAMLNIDLSRNAGWLAGGAGSAHAAGTPRDPRVHHAQIEIVSDFSAAGTQARIILHDASVFGVWKSRWEIDPRSVALSAPTGFPPEVEALLGEIATSFGEFPSGGSLGGLADLLQALQLAQLGDDNRLKLQTDALRNFLENPQAEIQRWFGRTADQVNELRANNLNALSAFLGLTTHTDTNDSFVLALNPDMELVLNLPLADISAQIPDFSVALRTKGEGIRIADALMLAVDLRLDNSARVTANLALRLDAAATAAGDLELNVELDSAGSTPLSVALQGVGIAQVWPTDSVELYPTVDSDALLQWLRYYVPGEVLRLALQWLREQSADAAIVDQLLDVMGLLQEGDSTNRVRNLAGIINNPRGWLSHADVLGNIPTLPNEPPSLNADSLIALLNAGRDLLGLNLPGLDIGSGVLPLPYGASLEASAAVGGVTLQLSRSTDIATGRRINSAMQWTIGADLEVQMNFNGELELGDLDGLDYIKVQTSLATSSGGIASLDVRIKRTGDDEIRLGLLPEPSGFDRLADLAAGATVDYVLPLALDALLDTLKGVDTNLGNGLADLGDALGLREADKFNAPRLKTFMQAPANNLISQLTTQASTFLTSLDKLLTPYLDNVSVGAGGQITLSATSKVTLTLQTPISGADFALNVTVNKAHIITDTLAVSSRIDISENGLDGISIGLDIIDEELMKVAGVSFLPTFNVIVGDDLAAGNDRVELGLWSNEPANPDRNGIIIMWSLAGNVTLVSRSAEGVDSGASAAVESLLRGYAMPLVLNLLAAQSEIESWLNTSMASGSGSGSGSIGEFLQSVEILQKTGTKFIIHSTLVNTLKLTTPGALLGQLLKLLARLLEQLGGLIPAIGNIKLAFVAEENAGKTRFGIKVSLVDELDLVTVGDVRLFMETDASWLPPSYADDAGISILLLSMTTGDFESISVNEPVIKIIGLGFGAADKNNGKLIDLLASIDQIKLNAAYERDFSTASTALAGGRILLRNLTVPVGRATGNDNPVASGMLSQGNESSTNQAGDNQELAPAFSPQFILYSEAPDDGSALVFEFRGGEDRDEGPWWLSIQREFGPLYVEQVGLNVLNENNRASKVAALLDAGISIAGLSVGLDDLSITIPLDNPQNLNEWKIDLAGLAISYDGSGVKVAGGLIKNEIRVNSTNVTEYAGMLQVDVGTIGITGIGAYGVFPAGDGSTYTSLFGFAALRMPLGGPPPFFVNGLGGGMGVNRGLTLPALPLDVPDFPLVSAMNDDSSFARDPMAALRSFSSTFPPNRGHFWFAAGVRFSSFALVESVVVVSVETGDGVEISVLGLSQMQLPRPGVEMAVIELALRARFSSREALLSIEAQLTDNSWLLSRDCRLTGGFAFVVWFNKGEFVLSLGGYHPRFPKPSYFPTVPRLGFNWTVGSTIVIKGESYFALTASCVMAGGKLEASYRSSVVWATFTAGLDALISWDPFYYDVEIYIRVSAGVKIRICFFVCGTVKLGFSIGARVRIWGPQLRGVAELDLDVITVSVKFGATGQITADKPMPWGEFYRKYIAQGDVSEPSMGLVITQGMLTPEPGAGMGADASAGDGSANDPFRVNSEFAFTTFTRTASNSAYFGDDLLSHSATIPKLDLGAMFITEVSSRHTAELRVRGSNSLLADTEQLKPKVLINKVPMGVWDYIDRESRTPESKVEPAITGLEIRALVRVEGDARITVKPGIIEKGDPRPLPFHQERNSRPIYTGLVAGASLYIEQQPVDATGIFNVLRNNYVEVSLTARREMMAERTAPPRLAPLTEGMVDEIKAAVEVVDLPPQVEEPAVDIRVGRPRLDVVLRGNAAAKSRTAMVRTTVKIADKALSSTLIRMAAPTLDDVARRWEKRSVAQLQRVMPGVVKREQTVVLPAQGAATGRAGGLFELRRGYLNGAQAADSMCKAEQDFPNEVAFVAGDLYCWALSNARYDNQKNRPQIQISGNQRVRVVVLARAGAVLLDKTAKNFSITVPVSASRLVIAGIGSAAKDNDALPGYSGWHAGTQLRQVQSGVFLAPASVVQASGASSTRRGKAVLGTLIRAADALQQVFWSSTRLPATVRSVVLVLEAIGTATVADLETGVNLGLAGATRAVDEKAEVLTPVIIEANDRVYAVFALEAEAQTQAIYINVALQPVWRLSGVMGAIAEAENVAAEITARGLETVLSPFVGNETGRSTMRWIDSEADQAHEHEYRTTGEGENA